MSAPLSLPRSLLTAQPAGRIGVRGTEAEREDMQKRLDKSRMRVDIGPEFGRWRRLRRLRGFQSDAMVAELLLDCYEKNQSTLTPLDQESSLPPSARPADAPESPSDQDEEFSAEEISLYARRTSEYEEELCQLKEEIERQHRLLSAVLNPEVRLHRKDVHQLMTNEKEVPPEQQERSSSVKQENPAGAADIKEEQEEVWSSQEREQLQGSEEADSSMSMINIVLMKIKEDVKEEYQSLQPHQMKTEADGADCGGSGADSPLELFPHDRTSDLSASDTDDSGDWEESDGPQEGSDLQMKHSQNDLLQGHKEIQTEEKPFSCSVCHKIFQDMRHLKQHMLGHLSEKRFSCSVCKRGFNFRKDIVAHMRIHTGEKPFICLVCGKGFALRENLKKHSLIHTGEKPFSCSVCGKRFAQHVHLSRHSLVHSEEKPFVCSVCGKGFTLRGNLKKHAIIHSGEKPFSCVVCGRGFTANGSLKRHFIVHTGEKPFSCRVCDRSFSQPLSLKKHRCVDKSTDK